MSSLAAAGLLAVALAAAPVVSAGAIAGQVSGPSGPVAGVRVTALKPASWGLPELKTIVVLPRPHGPIDQRRDFVRDAKKRVTVLGKSETAKDGRFRLPSLPPGRVVLWVDGGERGQTALETEVGAPDLSVTLSEAFLLDGDSIVRLTANHPYPSEQKGIAVVAVHATLPLLVSGQTDSEGRFNLGHVPAGPYFVLGAGPGVAPAFMEITLPEPKPVPAPKPPKPAPEPEPEPAKPGIPRWRGPPPRLGLPDSSYHSSGRLFLAFISTASVSGTVTLRGAPVAGARVRIAQGEEIFTRATDTKGRFVFSDLLDFDSSVGLEATAGARVVRHCLKIVGEVGGFGCCAPTLGKDLQEVAANDTLTCQARLRLDAAPAKPSPDEVCACDDTVLDGLSKSAPQ